MGFEADPSASGGEGIPLSLPVGNFFCFRIFSPYVISTKKTLPYNKFGIYY